MCNRISVPYKITLLKSTLFMKSALKINHLVRVHLGKLKNYLDVAIGIIPVAVPVRVPE